METEDESYLIPRKLCFDTFEESYSFKEINDAISSLSVAYRDPILMYITGYEYHIIASRMNLPIGIVKNRIFFARKRLQVILKEHR
jgi:RNA polymerase sigma-70 factor (ECF subfamily)